MSNQSITDKVDIQFQLKRIELVETRITAPVPEKQKVKTFQYNLNVEHRIIPEQKLFLNMVSVDVLGDDQETLLGRVKVAYSFEINNFDDFVTKEKDRANIPEDILSLFNSLSISTTRGIMFSQFRGTYLHNATLPVIDPKKLNKSN